MRKAKNVMTMPLISSLAAVGGALSLATSAPAAAAIAPAAAAIAPVSVVSCDYSGMQGSGGMLIPATAPFQTSNLRVTFVNSAPLAATRVRFAVGYDGRTQMVEDAGTFSTGTSITQDFIPSANLRYNGSATCSVQSVTFSDGSTWPAA
jgi:hypothetical protein